MPYGCYKGGGRSWTRTNEAKRRLIYSQVELPLSDSPKMEEVLPIVQNFVAPTLLLPRMHLS